MNEDMLNVFLNRHSVRSYTGEKIPMEKLNMIIMAGLSSASGSAIRPWELIVVRDKQKQLRCSANCTILFYIFYNCIRRYNIASQEIKHYILIRVKIERHAIPPRLFPFKHVSVRIQNCHCIDFS